MEHRIRIRNGRLEFIYDDALVGLLKLGKATVVRASYVEPHPSGGWLADMAPSGGPVLGLNGTSDDVDWSKVCDDVECQYFPNRCDHVALRPTPFPTREAALAAERAWLRTHKGL